MGRDGSSGPSLPFTVVAGWGRPAGVSFVGDSVKQNDNYLSCVVLPPGDYTHQQSLICDIVLINQLILLRINYIHISCNISHQKSRYLERVYIQYISPMLPQGRRKQTVTPYNTRPMQDHITRFGNTLHKYVCMFTN